MMSGSEIATSLQAMAAPATPKPSVARGDVAGARKTAEDFAAFFYSQSLENIFGNMSTDTMFGGGSGETVFKSMMTQEYGKIAAKSSGFGIVDAVQREILRLQEAA